MSLFRPAATQVPGNLCPRRCNYVGCKEVRMPWCRRTWENRFNWDGDRYRLRLKLGPIGVDELEELDVNQPPPRNLSSPQVEASTDAEKED